MKFCIILSLPLLMSACSPSKPNLLKEGEPITLDYTMTIVESDPEFTEQDLTITDHHIPQEVV